MTTWIFFFGSQADLEGAAENLFSSPHPQPLCFESLPLRTPQTVPPTPGTALQHKIESKLGKSLVNQIQHLTATANRGLSSVHAGNLLERKCN